jgi:hypothetical protein
MKNVYLTAVLSLTCLLCLGTGANAQDAEGVRVTVPFEFVAGGTTLPAGTYTVGRLSVDAYSSIEISGRSNGVFALPIAVDGTSSGKPRLSFQQLGGKYFLSEADTPGGIYKFALPRAIVALAQMKDHGKDQSTTSSGGTN